MNLDGRLKNLQSVDRTMFPPRTKLSEEFPPFCKHHIFQERRLKTFSGTPRSLTDAACNVAAPGSQV